MASNIGVSEYELSATPAEEVLRQDPTPPEAPLCDLHRPRLHRQNLSGEQRQNTHSIAMGRKPNPVALEFFVRGRKLDDASNRYEQTCKFCNEKVCPCPCVTFYGSKALLPHTDAVQFPKGRADTLVAHILKRCAAIPLQERQRAALYLETSSNAVDQTAIAYDANPQFAGLPLQTDPGLSALETLAEVSRHHLDYQTHSFGQSQDQFHDGDASPQPGQKRKRVQSQAKEKVFPLLQKTQQGFGSGVGQQQYEVTDADAQKLAAALYEAQAEQEIDPTAEFLVQDDVADANIDGHAAAGQETGDASAALQLAASAASELMAPNQLAGIEGLEPGANSLSTRFRLNAQEPMIDPQLRTSDQDHATDAISTGQSFTPIAIKPMPFDVGSDRRKQKPRGRFSEPRRKEVQQMRKLGACIRCRMLKKPCSDGTPCTQCTKIDNARLWKQPCIRTKLQEELALWSCGLFAVKAFKTTSTAREMHNFEPYTGRVEVTTFPELDFWLTLGGLQSTKPLTADVDPAIIADRNSSNSSEVYCVATETEDVLAKVGRYVKQALPHHQKWETSQFMSLTLEMANSIALDQPAVLLRSVSELWLCTKMLCGELPLHVGINGEETAFEQPLTLTPDARTTSERDASSLTYQLVNAQILSAIEKQATALARSILMEVERRLVQRQQSHQAEIFIVSVILVACVERMCRLLHSFSGPRPDGAETGTVEVTDQQTGKPHDNLTDPALQHLEDQLLLAAGSSETQVGPEMVQAGPDWPLDQPPGHFEQQGDRFTDILNMLLQMRDITPSTDINEAGIIVASGNAPSIVSEWIAAVQVSDEQLHTAAGEDGPLKYLGKLLGQQ